ncbi:MAG: hypothetical protein AAB836_00115 [Patescibacteria group bacterium]
MIKNCKNCSAEFEITNDDLDFYGKIKVPEPTFCPDCRLQRRLMMRNEKNLYKRSCDFCKKSIIAFFDSDVNFPVYCTDCWWSDKWDPRSYGQDFNFNRPFFEQFKELINKVPKANLLQLNNENSEYNSLLAFSKNTYMSPGSYLCEGCIYVRKSQSCKDCINSNIINKCELVSNSVNCDSCYSSDYLLNCRSCSFSSYLDDCSNMQNSFMCSGVRNKNYCFKNKELTKEEFEKILAEYKMKNHEDIFSEFMGFSSSLPKRAVVQFNCENSTGDYLYNSKNAVECFDSFDILDSKYLVECSGIKDSMDLCMHDKEIELCYEMSSGGEKNYMSKFCYCSIAAPFGEYLYSCFYLSNSFGCDGFHSKNEYCILNKQYSKEGYEVLVARVIEYMKTAGEYGEFFPNFISTFAYNESAAQDYFPLSKEEIISKGYVWKEAETAKAPSEIAALDCIVCKKQYRVIKQEQALYDKLNLKIPKRCSECRYKELLKWKNPRKLWTRACAKCGNKIHSSYSPERAEIVYCEACYLASVY